MVAPGVQPPAPSQPLGGLKGSLSAVTHFEYILGSSQLSNVELIQASFFMCNSGSFSQIDVVDVWGWWGLAAQPQCHSQVLRKTSLRPNFASH